MISNGSSVLPLLLLILLPSPSLTRAWIYTSLKGLFPIKWFVIITIRATQKKMISKPVTRTEDGKKSFKSFDSLGALDSLSQKSLSFSNVENGTKEDENHVSSTSLSCVSSPSHPSCEAIAWA